MQCVILASYLGCSTGVFHWGCWVSWAWGVGHCVEIHTGIPGDAVHRDIVWKFTQEFLGMLYMGHCVEIHIVIPGDAVHRDIVWKYTQEFLGMLYIGALCGT